MNPKPLSNTTDSPRKQVQAGLDRGSAKSVLLTVLGELAWPAGTTTRTSTLLSVMGGQGFEEPTARQAIVRAADSGWILPHRQGREVSWSITPKLNTTFEEGSQRLDALSEPFLDWDSRWLVLSISVPISLRAQRKRLYRDLTFAGLGNPFPGLWLTPHAERQENLIKVVEHLGLAETTISLLGTVQSIGLDEAEIVAKGWDLATLAEQYEALAEEFSGPLPQEGDQLLATAVRAAGALQQFPFSDPQLPEALLPNWIGRTVVSHIQSLRRGWSAQVQERWMELNNS